MRAPSIKSPAICRKNAKRLNCARQTISDGTSRLVNKLPGDDPQDTTDILTHESRLIANRSAAVDGCTDDSLREILQFALNRKKRQIKATAASIEVKPLIRPRAFFTKPAFRRVGNPKPAPAPSPTTGGNIVEYQPANRRLSVAPDTTLLAAALNAGIPIRHDCGGKGQCGTCRVKVANGGNNLTPFTPPEQKLLANLLNQSWRLACQTKARGPVSISVPPVTK